jgi:hypothetical protein
MFRNVMHSIGKKRADGHLRNSANIHDVAVKGEIPCGIPRMYPRQTRIKVGYTWAMSCHTTKMDKVMIMLVGPWEIHRLQVRM